MRPRLASVPVSACRTHNPLTHKFPLPEASCLFETWITAYCCGRLGFLFTGHFVHPDSFNIPSPHKISGVAVQEEPQGYSTPL